MLSTNWRVGGLLPNPCGHVRVSLTPKLLPTVRVSGLKDWKTLYKWSYQNTLTEITGVTFSLNPELCLLRNLTTVSRSQILKLNVRKSRYGLPENIKIKICIHTINRHIYTYAHIKIKTKQSIYIYKITVTSISLGMYISVYKIVQACGAER